MTQAKRSARSSALRLTERVQHAVAGSVDRAEEIHRRIASFPLETMEQLELFEETVKDLREIQDRSIAAAYDVARVINRDVMRLVKQVLRPERGNGEVRSSKAARRAASAATAHQAA